MAQDNTPSILEDEDGDGSVSEAAAKIEAMLSDPEDTQVSAALPTKKAKKAPANVSDDDDEPLDNPLVDDDEDEEDEGDEPAPKSKVDENDEEDEEEDDEQDDDEDDSPILDLKRLPKNLRVGVKVDGQTKYVPITEALAGFSRTDSFTQKSQKLADEHRQKEATFAAREEELRAQSEHYTNRLSALEEALAQPEPDWDAIPAEQFAQVHAAWQVHQSRLGRIAAERQNEIEKQRAIAGKQQTLRVQRETEALVKAVPLWGDQTEKGKSFRKAVHSYGISQGFSADELGNVADHRALNMLQKAFLYDQAVADKAERLKKGKTKVEALKASLKPRAQNAPLSSKRSTKQSKVTALKARAAKTGRVQDAADAIEAMMD